jgi:DNA polymerase V
LNTNIKRFYDIEEIPKSDLPIFSYRLPAGFPTRIDGDTPTRINIVEFLIKHPKDTCFGVVEGDSMEDEGIYDGDLLVIDRVVEPIEGCIIIAFLDGEFTVKKFSYRNGRLFLVAGNKRYPAKEIKEGCEFEVWGVVTYVIQKR